MNTNTLGVVAVIVLAGCSGAASSTDTAAAADIGGVDAGSTVNALPDWCTTPADRTMAGPDGGTVAWTVSSDASDFCRNMLAENTAWNATLVGAYACLQNTLQQDAGGAPENCLGFWSGGWPNGAAVCCISQ
jgi:hypothetical protein